MDISSFSDDDNDGDLLGLAARGWITTRTYIRAVKKNCTCVAEYVVAIFLTTLEHFSLTSCIMPPK